MREPRASPAVLLAASRRRRIFPAIRETQHCTASRLRINDEDVRVTGFAELDGSRVRKPGNYSRDRVAVPDHQHHARELPDGRHDCLDMRRDVVAPRGYDLGLDPELHRRGQRRFPGAAQLSRDDGRYVGLGKAIRQCLRTLDALRREPRITLGLGRALGVTHDDDERRLRLGCSTAETRDRNEKGEGFVHRGRVPVWIIGRTSRSAGKNSVFGNRFFTAST